MNIPLMKENKIKHNKNVYFIFIIAALGGLLFGLDQGFTANSLSTINFIYNLNTHQIEKYSAILAWGGIVGAILSGVTSRFIGRKNIIIASGILFTILSIISVFLPSFKILMMCRLGLGIAVGIASFTVPLYIAETAPAYIRGSLSTLFQLMITIGIFIISLTNILIVKIFGQIEISLSLMFTVIVLFSVFMLVSSCFLPESPRWLMLKNRKTEAIKVLKTLNRPNAEIILEINEISNALNLSKKKTFFNSLTNKNIIKIIFLGIFLQIFQQLIGINIIIYYAPTIFEFLGISSFLACIIIPTVNMLFTIPAITCIDKLGRKKLLYLGSFVMAISMISLGTVCYFIKNLLIINPVIFHVLILLFSVVYILGFAFSWGPIIWVVCSEIFPICIRETGIMITTMTNWIFTGLILSNTLSLMELYGEAKIFFIFALFCILSIIYIRIFLPETKCVSLEKIEHNITLGIKLNEIGCK